MLVSENPLNPLLGRFLTPATEAEEITFHQLLGRHRLAPSLLFRFANGHAYPFVEGEVCTVSTLAEAHVQRGVAAELARWHTVLPTGPGGGTASAMLRQEHNVWATAKRWLDAAPGGLKGKEALRRDFDYLVQRVLKSSGQAPQDLVLGHGDLLCANVILPRAATEDRTDGRAEVRFIDYEHACYCPRAFDLANHFSEWAGFDCDYSRLPTRSTRREFLHEYLATCHQLRGGTATVAPGDELEQLEAEVNKYRGFPGFYWGLCALIQAHSTTGAIGFDYAGYAETRLAEFDAWKAEDDGSRSGAGLEMPSREARWAMA
ncbi:hypothetical protein PG999_002989 [Apiospora kogelbergensis]|uniref:ethanolamine kinase n=1 Tax=Apiospora kogelbergensis TaxID=1337665 RepID=A0AAW0R9X7_9PEZI